MKRQVNRRSAKELVRESVAGLVRVNWFATLSDEDRRYIRDIIAAVRATPQARLYTVADAIVRELGLSRTRQTVYTTLKELLNEKA